MTTEPTTIIVCECSADQPRTAEECMVWNTEHNPGTRYAERPCSCDCHWTAEEWDRADPDYQYHDR